MEQLGPLGRSDTLEFVLIGLSREDFTDNGVPDQEHFARMEALGFGSEADHRRCFGADPDEYPLPEDACWHWP